MKRKNNSKQKKTKNTEQEKPLSREAKRIRAFAFFWYYAMLFVSFASAIALWIIFYNIDTLREFTPLAALGAGGIGLIIIGIENMIATVRRMPHMFCIAQALKRKEMTPEKINWNSLDTKEFVYTGMGIAIVGLLLVASGILFTFVI